MSLFIESENALNEVQTLNPETLEAPQSRIGTPAAVRGIYNKRKTDDSDGAFNRSLVQKLMDFGPPHDDAELENKGQGDRFNITTGEGPAIKNEAVAAYMDIYTTPKVLVDIPLTADVDKEQAHTWSVIMAEEYTIMDRADDSSLPLFLQLADTYVTHGVAIGYFDDKNSMRYSVAGLDHFKFPREQGIITSATDEVTALGFYSATDLYAKIGTDDGWSEQAIRLAILQSASASSNKDWENWELIQRDIKANSKYVDALCNRIEVVHCWVKEFSGKVSYYIAAKTELSDKNGWKEEFLFKSEGHFNSIDELLQIFPFSVGNGGLLYTVRGLGYLIYQLCNAMDIMHCKLLDNARVGSSLILQPASTEDAQDMTLIDAGGAIMIPPTMKMPERQMGQNLNNTLVPAINESRNILNRATGGLASGNMMLQDNNDRQTKLEVSSKLDYINKLNSFAINLFYGPYDKLMREKVRRAFTVRQKDKQAAKQVEDMKGRCVARGVPPEIFTKIDFPAVKASRIIGTGSRSSRILLFDQLQQMFSSFDAEGRENFIYDYLCELVGPEKADRYVGKLGEKRVTYDDSIATLENFQLLEGDYMEPKDGQIHMVHIPIHLEELESGLQGVDEGTVDLMDWTSAHTMLFQHLVATLEVTTVHETVQPELNQYQQRVQQIGEIVNNGLKMINKQKREQTQDAANPGQEELSEQQKAEQKLAQEMQASEAKHQQKMQHDWQGFMAKLEMIKQAGQQKMIMSAQEAMSRIATKDAEVQQRLARLRASSI